MRFDEIIEYERKDAAQEAIETTTLEVRRKSVLELLEECGMVPQSLREQIHAEQSEDVLKKWLKLAAKVDTIEEFIEKM